MVALVRRIKGFLKLLRVTVTNGGYKFSFGKVVAFRYEDGKRKVCYAYRIECLTEAPRPLDVIDVVASYLVGEPMNVSATPEILEALGLTKKDVGKIIRAASEMETYEVDGTCKRFSRKLRRDLLEAVGLKETHPLGRPRPASF